MDPNREVPPQFLLATLEMKDGESVGGLISNETATTVTLRLPGGSEKIVPRAAIASLKTLPQSLMPEGLEACLSPQDMADLIQFIFGSSN